MKRAITKSSPSIFRASAFFVRLIILFALVLSAGMAFGQTGGEEQEPGDTEAYVGSPQLTYFAIHNGAAEVNAPEVVLNCRSTGYPTHYMASEDPYFADGYWRPYSTLLFFTLSSGYGTKTVYFKLMNDYGESNTLSDKIFFNDIYHPTGNYLRINNGAYTTTSRTVVLNNYFSGYPRYYKASESRYFSGVAWKTYSTAPAFMLSAGQGNKTVYFKVRYYDGRESTVAVDTIELTGSYGAGITLISPSGGEQWLSGRTYQIQWSYSGTPGSYVYIRLLKNGYPVKNLATSKYIGTGGYGYLSWKIPYDLEPGNDYQIAIASTYNPSYSDTSDYFSIGDISPYENLNLITPNGGENWNAGSYRAIQWEYMGYPGNYVKIQLLKGGVPVRTISSSKSIGSGGYGYMNWYIPTSIQPGEDYQIRITSTTNAGYTDTSDYTFAICGMARPGLTVISPNNGENWAAGTLQTIEWHYTGSPGSYVNVQLVKAGYVVQNLASYMSIGSGGYGNLPWEIPWNQLSGNDYKIRVTSTTNSGYTDTSDYPFTISGGSAPGYGLNIISPNFGEDLETGSYHVIQWTYSGEPGPYVKIQLLKSGRVVQTISSKAKIGSYGFGTYNWYVPTYLKIGDDYQIMISSIYDPMYSDMSDWYFSISTYYIPQ